jgi:hypothetical protein
MNSAAILRVGWIAPILRVAKTGAQDQEISGAAAPDRKDSNAHFRHFRQIASMAFLASQMDVVCKMPKIRLPVVLQLAASTAKEASGVLKIKCYPRKKKSMLAKQLTSTAAK